MNLGVAGISYALPQRSSYTLARRLACTALALKHSGAKAYTKLPRWLRL